jgi:beta-galactosidase
MTSENRITRREFIETSGLVAAMLIHPSAYSATSETSSTQYSHRLLTGWEFHQGPLGGIWEVWRAKEVADNHWQATQLPHCFNARDAVDPDQPYYQGPGWYRINLKVANPYPNGRTLLHFEGAGQTTDVFVHLEKLAHHVGGYDEFVVDLTDAVSRLPNAPSPNDVPVAVLCDNSRDLERIPSDLSDFTLYGGLYRYVNLLYVPAISVGRIHVQTTVAPHGRANAGFNAHAAVKVSLYNPRALEDELQFELRALDPDGNVIYHRVLSSPPWTGEKLLFDFELAKPQLWSPSSPSLYRCELTLSGPDGKTALTERFGLRYCEFMTHGPFKLNGERVLIRGTQRHEDHAGLGAALPEELTAREMRLIKELGANFVRLGHYQQSRSVLDLCDELGLLVWEEVPWCRGGVGGPAYRSQARDMLRNMIDQHYNHPSIILWGLGNENDWPGDFPAFSQDDVRALMTELNSIAHQMDPGRKTAIRRCEFAKDIPDVYSPSIWMGWYRGQYTEYAHESFQQMQKVEHFLHMEWGGDSHAGRHSEQVDEVFVAGPERPQIRIGYDFQTTGSAPNPSKEGVWSETYLCNLFDWCLKEQETMPWLSGAAQWSFKDFATPLRPENPVPRVNQKGLVERDLTPKEGFYVFQSYWSHRPMVHIYGHTWPVRCGEPDERKLVKVYSNCDTVELFLNGASCGVRKRNSQDFPAAGLRWIVSFRAGENRMRAVGHSKGLPVEDEVRFQYQTAKWGKAATLELKEFSREGDLVTLELWARDENQVLCLDARNRVRFEIAGEGSLQDNLGTVSGSRVVELRNGRAQVTVSLRQGRSVVSASTDGLPTAFLFLT